MSKPTSHASALGLRISSLLTEFDRQLSPYTMFSGIWIVCFAGFLLFMVNLAEHYPTAHDRATEVMIWGGFLSGFGSQIWSRNNRGILLLDIGPAPQRWINLGAAIGCFLGAYYLPEWAYLLFRNSAPANVYLSEWYSSPFQLILPFLGVASLISAKGRFQIRENGIWVSGMLMKWKSIKSIHWVDDRTLIVVYKPTIFISKIEQKYRIPANQRDAANKLLLRFVPNGEAIADVST